MLKLLDRFDSVPFERYEKRCYGLHFSKQRAAGAAVDHVLDFFDDAALMAKKGALDEEIMWHGFYHWIRPYLQAAEKYINEYRQNEPAVWKDLFRIYPRWLLHEAPVALNVGGYAALRISTR